MIEYLFPSAMTVLSFLAAITYAVHGDVSHAIYWGAAGILTATVTWGFS